MLEVKKQVIMHLLNSGKSIRRIKSTVAGLCAKLAQTFCNTTRQGEMRTIKLFLSYDLLGNLTLGNRPQGNNLKGKSNPHKDIHGRAI